MELQQLKYFITIVETKKLREAARICEMTESGMRRSIGALEANLGVKLLQRSSGNLETTEYGSILLPIARIIVSHIERLSNSIKSSDISEKNKFGFGVTNSFHKFFIPMIIKNLNFEFPNVAVEVRTDKLDVLIDDLESGAVDCVFALTGNESDRPDIVFRKITRHRPKIIARRNHPLFRDKNNISPSTLAKAQWASFEIGEITDSFNDFFNLNDLQAPSKIIKTDVLSTIIDALTLTDIITLIPPEFIGEEIIHHDLTIINCIVPNSKMFTSMITRKPEFTSSIHSNILSRMEEIGSNWLKTKTESINYGNAFLT